ncbi:MAG: hypothetical protein JXB49_25115 [Bacteroidales bacterium]|nr:hypothetical protein [Bacteroidales bacterium]
MKTPCLLVFVALIAFCGCTRKPDRIIGVKIYEYSGDYDALAQKWEEAGINTAFVSTSLAANDTFRQALRKHHIPVFIIFPVFQNPEFLKEDSSIYAITDKGEKARNDWVEFVCPSRAGYRNSKTAELAGLVKRYDPDGISIDFIRHFVFWEMIYPDRTPESIDRACYCDNCLAEFSYKQGIDLPDTCVSTPQKARFIASNYAAQYDSFRCFLVTTMVKDLAETAKDIKPTLKISVHAVPWREGDFGGANIRVAGQDLAQIAPYADFISPMCYSQMLKRDAAWISSVVADMDKRAPGKILPSIQVYPYYIDDAFTAEDFRLCMDAALDEPSRGVVFWSWPLLEKEKRRIEVVGEEVKN